jgi:phosphonate transport system ATP-binding protein
MKDTVKMGAQTASAIEICNLSKTFGDCKALKSINLSVQPGEMVALIGPSGSGKSTLLRHISGLVAGDNHHDSRIEVFGRTAQRNGRIAGNIRNIRSEVGVVFQQFNLVGRLSLLTNILTGMLSRIPFWRSLIGWFRKSERLAAMKALHRVGMDRYAAQRASTLSGGQQQRGAIARALLQKARIILADEPIASLDPQSAKLVMGTLQRLNREDGLTVVVSLHQIDYAFRFCRRSVALKNGAILFDGPTEAISRNLLKQVYGSDLLEDPTTATCRSPEAAFDGKPELEFPAGSDSLAVDAHHPALSTS